MNSKEVHYEGWLIKSPPSKRIWRHRWRRRWFTLKQGEIPEQFCLEYYTDRNCRKLKGVIDLDQCEQVDCGLRLENRKQKFQYMFDIKTPKRTYYLAADTEADMRDWVNCICQVCHLHDTKQSSDLNEDNLSPSSICSNPTNLTAMTTLLTDSLASVLEQPLETSSISNSNSVYVNADYTNRGTLIADINGDQQHLLSEIQQQPPPSPATAIYLNHSALLEAQLQAKAHVQVKSASLTQLQPSNSFSSSSSSRLTVNSNGVIRKIPENLVLNNAPLPEAQQHSVQPSPALSTSSGPYIPISECFSGSPKFPTDTSKPKTPLNNLDPRFYDAPRSQNNIGLNLSNAQSYSPKIFNCALLQPQIVAPKTRQHRSDSDSEGVFTDDDEWAHPMPLRENSDRKTRPSESSIENETLVLTFSQRFSKVPEGFAPDISHAPLDQNCQETQITQVGGQRSLGQLAKALKNKNNLILDFEGNSQIQREIPQLSDTENSSPAVGQGHETAPISENNNNVYSQQASYYNIGQIQESVVTPMASSTPNLSAVPVSVASTLFEDSSISSHQSKNSYSNAMPIKAEGNVFRYDFMEPSDCPPVDRKLKPKLSADEKHSVENIGRQAIDEADTLVRKLSMTSINSGCFQNKDTLTIKPPSVDRRCKPNSFKIATSTTNSIASRRSSGTTLSMVLPHEAAVISSNNSDSVGNTEARTLPRSIRTSPKSPGCSIQHQRTASAAAAMQLSSTPTTPNMPLPLKQGVEHKLQYFDLDVSNKPAVSRQSLNAMNSTVSTHSTRARSGSTVDLLVSAPAAPSGVVYNYVDFVKTEAFKRIREERNKESENVNNGNKQSS